MFIKKAILKYESVIKEYKDILVPAKQKIPDWYKGIPKWNDNKIASSQNGIHKTIKACTPFMESLTTGYIITLPYDLYIENKNGNPYMIWQENIEYPPRFRNKVSSDNLVPAGHYPLEYVWDISLSFEVPIGHSMLLTHPLNRHDLPFTTLSGVIDGGYATTPHGSYPFYVKTGFEGIIEQGTPIMQIIPFKQQPWTLEKVDGLSSIGISNEKASNLVFSGWYKKNFWTRKDYS
jgi:hypothetical protein